MASHVRHSVDPIFALIETARLREEAVSVLCKELEHIEREMRDLGLSGKAEDNHPLMKDYNRRAAAAERAAGRAMRAVCSTAPTTPEGLHALIAFLRPQMRWVFKGEYADGRLDNLADTLEAAARAIAGIQRDHTAAAIAIAAE